MYNTYNIHIYRHYSYIYTHPPIIINLGSSMKRAGSATRTAFRRSNHLSLCLIQIQEMSPWACVSKLISEDSSIQPLEWWSSETARQRGKNGSALYTKAEDNPVLLVFWSSTCLFYRGSGRVWECNLQEDWKIQGHLKGLWCDSISLKGKKVVLTIS